MNMDSRLVAHLLWEKPMTEEKEFDVVLDALYQRMDALLKLTNQNIEMGMFGIMDQIRLEQIDQLVQAIKRHEENQ